MENTLTIEGIRIHSGPFPGPGYDRYEATDIPTRTNVTLRHYPANTLPPAEAERYARFITRVRAISAPELFPIFDFLPVTNPEGHVLIHQAPAQIIDTLIDTQAHNCTILEFLTMAMEMVEAVTVLHRHDIIHGAITPAAFGRDKGGKIRLLPPARSKESDLMAGPGSSFWGFAAPEQTNRTRAIVDFRTDIYALGATFFALLTEKPPFYGPSRESILSGILRETPVHPGRFHPFVPDAVATILRTLLAKAPENRYQSLSALHRDLATCKNRFMEGQSIPDFQPRQRDIPQNFQMGSIFCGRENELSQLLSLFYRAARGEKVTALISGPSGIGKSRLITALSPLVRRGGGLLVTGRFGQFDKNVPYAAYVQLLEAIVTNLPGFTGLSEEAWRQRFIDALGSNARILTDQIPILSELLGPQPEIPETSPAETRNRFVSLCDRFLEAIVDPKHPIVIAIEDMHWADHGSIEIFGLFGRHFRGRGIFIIGTFRNAEEESAPALTAFLKTLRNASYAPPELILSPLPQSAVGDWLKRLTGNTPARCRELGTLLWEISAGIPRQIRQELRQLHGQKQLFYDFDQGIWDWNDSVCREFRFDRQPAPFFNRLDALSSVERNILRHAACLGPTFRESELRIVMPPPHQSLSVWLARLVAADLLFTADTRSGNDPSYGFLYDKIRKNIRDEMDASAFAELSLAAGRRLWNVGINDMAGERILRSVALMNNGADQITDHKNRRLLADRNLEAARRALTAAAGETALTYIEKGIYLLGPDPWLTDRERIRDFFIIGAQAAYHAGKPERLYYFCDRITKEAFKAEDHLLAAEIKIQALTAQNRLSDAVTTALDALATIGIRLKRHPGHVQVVKTLALTQARLVFHSNEFLLRHPRMQVSIHKATMRILARLLSPAYLSEPGLYAMVTCAMVRLILKHGNAPESPSAFTAYGILQCCTPGLFASGFRMGTLALQMAEDPYYMRESARAVFAANVFIRHWTQPLTRCLPFLRKAHATGLETGNFESSAFAAMTWSAYGFLAGRNLQILKQEMLLRDQLFIQMGQTVPQTYNRIFLQTVHNLRSQVSEPFRLQGPYYNRIIEEETHLRDCDKGAIFLGHFCETILGCMFQQYEEALRSWKTAEQYRNAVRAQACLPYHDWIGILIHTAREATGQKKRQNSTTRKLFYRLRKWAIHNPESYGLRLDIARAEIYRIQGKPQKARPLYLKALHDARENGGCLDETLISARTARFFREEGFPRNAAASDTICWHACSSMGITHRQLPGLTAFPGAPDRAGSEPLTDALMAISSALAKNDLLRELLTATFSFTGATEVYFLQHAEPGWNILAECCDANRFQLFAPPLRITEKPDLFLPVLRHVRTTHRLFSIDEGGDVVIKDLVNANPELKMPSSLACVPVLRGDSLVGMLYLIHREVRGIFSRTRLRQTELLAAQAAIAYENVALYRNLKEEIHERKRAQRGLQLARQNLEKRIRERTCDLENINLLLQKEIYDRNRAEKALVTSETRYRSVIQRISDGLGMHDQNGIITFVNDRLCEITGYTKEELLGKEMADFIDPSGTEQFLKEMEERDHGERGAYEIRLSRKDQTIRTMMVSSEALLDADGNYTGSFAAFTDITELKEMARALRHSEAQVRALINATSDAAFMIDVKGRILVANAQTTSRVGLPEDAIIGTSLFDTICEMDIEHRKMLRDLIVETGKTVSFETLRFARIFDVSVYPVFDSTNTVDRIAIYARDITDLRHAERQIGDLTRRLFHAQENERRKIARDLHDDVAQNLSFLKISVDNLVSPDLDPEDPFREKTSLISEQLRSTIQAIRNIAYDLRPPELDRLGLVRTAYRFCEEFGLRHKVRVDFQSAGMDTIDRNPDLEINVYRMIQEAMNNIARHANADQVAVRLTLSHPHILVRVEDNGKGFDLARLSAEDMDTCMGLSGMEERVSLLGGKFRIDTRPGKGTKLYAEIPIPGSPQSPVPSSEKNVSPQGVPHDPGSSWIRKSG